jgi:hypothetical protein
MVKDIVTGMRAGFAGSTGAQLWQEYTSLKSAAGCGEAHDLETTCITLTLVLSHYIITLLSGIIFIRHGTNT